MIVRTTGNNFNSAAHQSVTESLCIINNVLLVNLEVVAQSFLEADCLCRNHMHQRTALDAGENSLVEVVFFCCFLVAQNHTASGSAECLVGCGGDHIRIGNGTRMKACCHKTRNMRHIHHQNRTYFIRYLTEFFEVDGSCIGRSAGNN